MCATCGCGKKGPMKKDDKKKGMPFEKKEAKGVKKSAHEKGESKKAEKLEHLKAKKKK